MSKTISIVHVRPWPDSDQITVWDSLEDDETVCPWCMEVCKGARPSSQHADDGGLCASCLEESFREASQ
jgi:hypothetical protein